MIGADWMAGAAQIAGLIVVASAALVILIGRARKMLAPVQSFFKRADAANEILVGRPAITHPDTNEVLAPATPGLGVRLAHMEEAIVSIASTKAEVGELRRDLHQVAIKLDTHIAQHDAATPPVTVVQNLGGTNTH